MLPPRPPNPSSRGGAADAAAEPCAGAHARAAASRPAPLPPGVRRGHAVPLCSNGANARASTPSRAAAQPRPRVDSAGRSRAHPPQQAGPPAAAAAAGARAGMGQASLAAAERACPGLIVAPMQPGQRGAAPLGGRRAGSASVAPAARPPSRASADGRPAGGGAGARPCLGRDGSSAGVKLRPLSARGAPPPALDRTAGGAEGGAPPLPAQCAPSDPAAAAAAFAAAVERQLALAGAGGGAAAASAAPSARAADDEGSARAERCAGSGWGAAAESGADGAAAGEGSAPAPAAKSDGAHRRASAPLAQHATRGRGACPAAQGASAAAVGGSAAAAAAATHQRSLARFDAEDRLLAPWSPHPPSPEASEGEGEEARAGWEAPPAAPGGAALEARAADGGRRAYGTPSRQFAPPAISSMAARGGVARLRVAERAWRSAGRRASGGEEDE